MEFRETGVTSPEAATLLEELNETLIALIGHNGTKHVNLADFEGEHSAFIVGSDEGGPVCCAGIRRFGSHTGEVKRVYARRHHPGAAKALMAYLEVWAAAHGYTRLILECRDNNPHAIAFYGRCGYRVCERYTPYEDQEDAVCMEKGIGAAEG